MHEGSRTFVDGLYFTMMTMSTVGYGDISVREIRGEHAESEANTRNLHATWARNRVPSHSFHSARNNILLVLSPIMLRTRYAVS
eukprot:1616652-Rhodomonas_salina.1